MPFFARKYDLEQKTTLRKIILFLFLAYLLLLALNFLYPLYMEYRQMDYIDRIYNYQRETYSGKYTWIGLLFTILKYVLTALLVIRPLTRKS